MACRLQGYKAMSLTANKLSAPRKSGLLLLILLAAWLPGCTTVKITETPRAATEQLLLSTATDRALLTANLEMFAGKKVFLDPAYFDSYDSKYVLGTIRDAFSRAGAILVSAPSNSDAIIEARSGALATDSSTSLIGIPTLGVPVPLTGAITIPEIALYKSQKQNATAKIVLLAYAGPSGRHLYSSGSLTGKSYNNYYHAIGFSFHSTDIPELQKNLKNTEKYESWQADYTAQNFAPTNAPVSAPPTNSVAAINTTTNNAMLSNMNTNSPPATNNVTP